MKLFWGVWQGTYILTNFPIEELAVILTHYPLKGVEVILHVYFSN